MFGLNAAIAYLIIKVILFINAISDYGSAKKVATNKLVNFLFLVD